MRVLEMVSRMSAIQLESRSNEDSSSVLISLTRILRDISLRASTISDTPFISWSIRLSGRRVVREVLALSEGIGRNVAGANVGQHILGGVAQPFEAREVEKAATALDGVEKAEQLVQQFTIGWVRFQRDHDIGQRFKRLLRFRNKFG